VRVRRLLAVILVLGSLGLGLELLLLGHFEEPAQFVPLVLIAAGLLATAWAALRPTPRTTMILRSVAAGQIAGGLVGVALHYQSNVEFAHEMYSDLRGYRLVREALTGAVPALAPGALIQLGLLGVAYTIKESTP
jgi:hypothetical protein